MLESDADRLESIRTVGEPFSTGSAQKLYGIWDCPSIDVDGGVIPVKDRKPQIECRESDIAAHALVKRSSITRDADGAKYFVRDLDYDGTGMATILLSE